MDWEKKIVAAGLIMWLTFMAVVTSYIALNLATAPEDGRKVLCIGIIENKANTARLNPEVLRLCEAVGVTP